jgi:hypothetical protein
MRRIGLAGSFLVAALAISAVTAMSASAAPPEFGRCVKVAHGTGEYNSSNCIAPEGARNFDWVPGPGPETKFTTSFEGEPVIKSTGASKTRITCSFGEGEGEYTGAKTEKITKLAFHDCETPVVVGGNEFARWCQNVGNFRGEITMNELSGELGYIKATAGVGMDLKALSGENMVLFECGGANETTEHGMGTGVFRELTGSVIGMVRKANIMTTEGQVKFVLNRRGAQVPQHFEGMPKDTLTTLVGLTEKTPEPTTLTALDEVANKEKMEIKNK